MKTFYLLTKRWISDLCAAVHIKQRETDDVFVTKESEDAHNIHFLFKNIKTLMIS